jgi:secondary thiamine-phosphate synthase enzyme
MTSTYSTFKKETTGSTDIIDITDQVAAIVEKSSILNGSVNIFMAGSTAALTTIEYESGVIKDLKDAIERLAPRDMHYTHDSKWGDGNGFAHVEQLCSDLP